MVQFYLILWAVHCVHSGIQLSSDAGEVSRPRSPDTAQKVFRLGNFTTISIFTLSQPLSDYRFTGGNVFKSAGPHIHSGKNEPEKNILLLNLNFSLVTYR